MSAVQPLEPLLTPEEVASILRVSLSSIYTLAKTRQIAATRVGVQWRFTRAAVEAYTRGETPPGAAPVTPIASGRRRRV